MQEDRAEQTAWLGQTLLSDDEKRRAEAHSLGIPFVTLSHDDISLDALVLIPEPLSRTRNIIAYRVGDNSVEVALLDMADLEAIDFLRVQHRIVPRLTSRSSIKHALLVYQRHLKEKFAGMVSQGKEAADSLLRHALHSGAHYIHIEPTLAEATGHVVHYRIRGLLHEAMRLPQEAGNFIALKVKELARLFPVSTTAQEGSFTLDNSGEPVGVSVATSPTARGEKITMRLARYNKGVKGYSLQSLGLWGNGLEEVYDAINAASGAIIVAGLSGGGKTTTLYTMLDHFYNPALSVASVESTHEHTLPRVHQTIARPDIGLTLPSALRSVLKQDPDVVMVGDLDSGDASTLALQASRRRVKILGAIEARSAAGVFDVLYLHDVPSLLAAATVRLVVAQKLTDRLCNACKVARPLSRVEGEVLEHIVNFKKVLDALRSEGVIGEHAAWKDITFYTADGCVECKDTPGYSGSVALFEVLPVTHTLATLIKSGGSRDEIEEAARDEGMLTLLEDALFKSVRGEVDIMDVVELADRG